MNTTLLTLLKHEDTGGIVYSLAKPRRGNLSHSFEFSFDLVLQFNLAPHLDFSESALANALLKLLAKASASAASTQIVTGSASACWHFSFFTTLILRFAEIDV